MFKPIWPVSKKKESIASVQPVVNINKVNKQELDLNPVLEVKQDSISQKPNIDKIDELINKMDSLVSVLSKPEANHLTTSPNSVSKKSNESDDVRFKEPIFIPSKIIPDNTEVSVSTSESDQVRPDIAAATAALKNLKKKKK
jgi:hypothetical protein